MLVKVKGGRECIVSVVDSHKDGCRMCVCFRSLKTVCKPQLGELNELDSGCKAGLKLE